MKNSTQWIAAIAATASLALTASPALGQQSNTGAPAAAANRNQQVTGQTAATNTGTNLEAQARQTVRILKQKNPKLKAEFQSAVGYAVFPNVTEGAALVGGAYGQGVVFQNGRPVGTVTLSKGTVGAQLGGESFSEVIFFQSAQALNQLKEGNFQFTAGVNAVGASAGVGAQITYRQGFAVVVASRSGLMAKAAVGGQKFGYQPMAVGGASSAGQSGMSSGSVTNTPTQTDGNSQ